MTPNVINRTMMLAYQITTGAGYNPNKSVHHYPYLINHDRQTISPIRSCMAWQDNPKKNHRKHNTSLFNMIYEQSGSPALFINIKSNLNFLMAFQLDTGMLCSCLKKFAGSTVVFTWTSLLKLFLKYLKPQTLAFA